MADSISPEELALQQAEAEAARAGEGDEDWDYPEDRFYRDLSGFKSTGDGADVFVVRLTRDEVLRLAYGLLNSRSEAGLSPDDLDVSALTALNTGMLVQSAPVPVESRHTVGGKTSDNGWPYGTTHDMDCPACVASGSSFTASPRSETYWAS